MVTRIVVLIGIGEGSQPPSRERAPEVNFGRRTGKKDKCMRERTTKPRCGDDTLCALTCCPCNLDIKKISPLVNEPRFICKSCGRVANEKKNLCQPAALR